MEQRHGIPERTNIEDGPGKTRRFILGSTILWCLVFAAFYYIETVVLQQELEFSSQFLSALLQSAVYTSLLPTNPHTICRALEGDDHHLSQVFS